MYLIRKCEPGRYPRNVIKISSFIEVLLSFSALDPINFNADPDPHLKKMDPDPNTDPGHFFKFTEFVLLSKIFKFFVLFFFAYVYAKT